MSNSNSNRFIYVITAVISNIINTQKNPVVIVIVIKIFKKYHYYYYFMYILFEKNVYLIVKNIKVIKW